MQDLCFFVSSLSFPPRTKGQSAICWIRRLARSR
uniref:Uncharacterized protein n=1 Tax=Rhizophora mucronata TaxID=61149 RepID=A0A2P2NAJ8_RHIMU